MSTFDQNTSKQFIIFTIIDKVLSIVITVHYNDHLLMQMVDILYFIMGCLQLSISISNLPNSANLELVVT